MYKYISEKKLSDTITSIEFSNNGKYLACGLINEQVHLWKDNFVDLSGQSSEIIEGHSLGVMDLKFNYSGNLLTVSSLDSLIRVYNVEGDAKLKSEH